jgi:phospholipase/carboxylesterase
MNLQTIEVSASDTPAASIIMLHGLGADGTDFLPLADEIDLSAVGPVRWVLPRAPMRPVTINGGYVMRAWYDILGTDLVRREDEAGLRQSTAQVHELIEREIRRGVPADRVVLAGFSQGCAITLMAGLRCPHRLAGLAGLSGYLP